MPNSPNKKNRWHGKFLHYTELSFLRGLNLQEDEFEDLSSESQLLTKGVSADTLDCSSVEISEVQLSTCWNPEHPKPGLWLDESEEMFMTLKEPFVTFKS